MDAAALAVTILAIIVVVSYFAGGMLNRRRATALVLSLRTRFPDSPHPRLTWRGQTSFRLEFEDPVRGVSQLVANALLVPREALLVWAVWAVRGRGDLLNLRADLESLPRGAGLVFDPGHRLGRAAWKAAEAAGGTVSEAGPGGLRIASYDEQGRTLMQRLLPVAEEAGHIVLLEVKAAQPRLTVLLSLRGKPEASVSHLASMLNGLVLAATR